MSQKCYKWEIIGLLLRERIHIRGMAKKLQTNQMMVARKVKELVKENVLDFNQEGKNKVFSLKKTAEARASIFMTEHYFLVRLINKCPQLRNLIDKINKNSKIKMALLFGSYAKGIPKEESDIDIYIDTTSKKIKKEIEHINPKINVDIGKYNKKSLLIKEIEKNHVVLKGVETYYQKNEFFN